jgi:hypothetical protein
MKANRYITQLAAVGLMGLLLTACHDEEWMRPEPIGNTIELRGEIEQQYATRASDGGFADGDEIGVFIANYDNGTAPTLQPSGNHADNVRFTYNEAKGTWTGSYQLYWKDKTTPVDAYGYYPFDANLQSTQAYPFSVQRNQRDQLSSGRKLSGYEASDFLWAKKENIVPTAAAITLLHHHIMAGIKVTLIEGEGFDEDEWDEITKSVLVESTILESTINLQTGKASPDGATTTSIIPQQKDDEFRAVIIPQTVNASESLFAITIDNKSYNFTRKEAMTYYPGKLHQFTFSVQKSLETGDYILSLISESITPWENDPLSHDGSAREYITVHVEEGEYIGDVIQRMGIDPKEIVNLKLTGILSGMGGWHSSPQFDYIHNNMPNLEAVHLKDLRTKEMKTMYWESGWGEIPYGVKEYNDDYLPMNAFESMSLLSHVVWPDSLKGISSGAFAGTNLKGSLILPEGLKYIGNSVFWAYGHSPTSMTGELYIPSTVEFIGDEAFAYTNFNCDLVLPERMTYLGVGAFRDCPFLTGQVHIPDGLDVLNGAFPDNMTAKMATVPQGVKVINGLGGQVISLVIPEGVTEINSLYGGSSQPWGPLTGPRKALRYVNVPSTVKKLGEWAFAGTNISHIQLPEGIEIIPYYAFGQCNLQDTLTLPSSVLQIHEQAFFANGKLSALVLPPNLGEIRDWAFAGCSSLYYIYSPNPEPPRISSNAFDGVEKNECALVVPEEAVDAYRNADGWREFKRISAYQNFVCRPMQAKLLNKTNTRTIVLNSDGNWKVTHCPSWLHPSKTSGTKKTEMTVKIDALSRGAANRRDSVVFTLQGKTHTDGSPITCCYSVSQFDYEHAEDGQVQLQKATKGNGINIVFVGDGYDAENIASGTYLEDVREGMEYFFGIEPYKTYQPYFNVYADMAMSPESGVCSSANIWRETKFKTTYGNGDNGRLGINPADVMAYIMQEVSNTAITSSNMNQSLIICLLNSDAYEGITTLYGTGAAVAFVPHSRYDYPNDYRGLIQHEAGGHGFGKLGDEYIYHRDNILTCKCICCAHAESIRENKQLGWYANLSLSGKYSDIDWRHLIFDDRYSDIVDIYEGGYMHGRGVYRSEVNSCMNNNVPYYSTISRQAIVERIMNYAGETFSFETFVSKDSRAWGDKFLTRSGGATAPTAMHGNAPLIIKGSPLDDIKRRNRKAKH